MPSTIPLSSRAPALEAVRARIENRFGLVPSFFMMARSEPSIVEAMFEMAEFAYLDSPLPTLFKERLFTYVSRFSAVPYCMVRHCAFLLGCGNVAGDPLAQGISVDDAIAMLRTPFPDATRRDQIFARLRAVESELEDWPDPRSELEDTIFFAAVVAFVLPQEHTPLLTELERVLGNRRYSYLLLFLGFIHFAHFWTESHPQLCPEDDIEQLHAEQRKLADGMMEYAAQAESEIIIARAELRELERLRALAEKREGDVARLRLQVAEQTHAVQLAEAEVRAKSTFMATLSHELRTPLNAVIGYTELLEAGLGGNLDAKAGEYIGRIKATARHQQQIIEEILSFSHLESGRETVLTEVVSLAEICDGVCAMIAPLAEARGLAFTVHFADAPPRFTTDPRKLRQVLLNLLGNAVKFTPSGAVTLAVARVGDSLVFTVTDTGPGIRPADRERVFEPFTQLDPSATRLHGGSGLGLAITKRLVTLLDGDIWVEAKEGNGSTFVVTFPYQRDRTA